MNEKTKVKRQTLQILEEIKGKETVPLLGLKGSISTVELLFRSEMSMKDHEEVLNELEKERKIKIFEKKSWGKYVTLGGSK